MISSKLDGILFRFNHNRIILTIYLNNNKEKNKQKQNLPCQFP